jgi:hypothetical protein
MVNILPGKEKTRNAKSKWSWRMGLRSKKGAWSSPSQLANYIARRKEGGPGASIFLYWRNFAKKRNRNKNSKMKGFWRVSIAKIERFEKLLDFL